MTLQKKVFAPMDTPFTIQCVFIWYHNNANLIFKTKCFTLLEQAFFTCIIITFHYTIDHIASKETIEFFRLQILDFLDSAPSTRT